MSLELNVDQIFLKFLKCKNKLRTKLLNHQGEVEELKSDSIL